ncbi:hypothetical protein AQI88_41190 [Streptomyces cellostaticus]|uniref:Uncharacterized protein n=1 Tax=Streptomyces cellostaticus TaxID=67285 RepID=A0A101N539_9ACTN|nr:hypothetical protein [Streptomyces cellostaticus]KUM86655.1 hypothetical protein AQI88_41190 [Streptomyces cellostaticus]GHI09480.1 hypothetical protein Scel_78010 [Streptomyces cellostaticus]
MSSPCDPQHAPAGDVGAALMMIDSRLKEIHDGKTGVDTEQKALTDQYIASLDTKGVNDVLDGVCTLVYMFMQWLRAAHEDHDKDVIEYVVPNVVGTMRMMPKSVRPEAIPTMAGLLVAAGTGLSPSLWRQQYGDWTEAELTPLEATALLLAEHINRITDDPNFATRMVTQALSSADED